MVSFGHMQLLRPMQVCLFMCACVCVCVKIFFCDLCVVSVDSICSKKYLKKKGLKTNRETFENLQENLNQPVTVLHAEKPAMRLEFEWHIPKDMLQLYLKWMENDPNYFACSSIYSESSLNTEWLLGWVQSDRRYHNNPYINFGNEKDSLFFIKCVKKPNAILHLLVDVSLTCVETGEICHAIFNEQNLKNGEGFFSNAWRNHFRNQVLKQQPHLTFKVCITAIRVRYKPGMLNILYFVCVCVCVWLCSNL